MESEKIAMVLRIWISAVLIELLVSVSVGLAAHSLRGWTRGYCSGSEISADDVIAYWAFEKPEKDGLVVVEDGSRMGNVLVEYPVSTARAGVVTLGPGKSGKDLSSATATDKDRACRAVSADFKLKRAFTVEMWFKLEPGLWAKANGRHLAFFCLNDQPQGGEESSTIGQLVQLRDAPPNTYFLVFQTRARDKPSSENRDVFIRHEVVLLGGKWHHVAFIWDGEKMCTYLDGKLLAEAAQPKGELMDASEIRNGSHFWMSGFLRSIDSVRVLDRAIPFAERGKNPTAQPRTIRNSTADTARTPGKWTKKSARVGSGDITMRFLQPHYRDNIYADQNLDEVVVEIHSALPHPVELRFFPKGGKATFTRRIKSVQDPVTVEIPAKNLAEGKHEVAARLVNPGGNVVSSKMITLRKLSANPNTVRLREDGVWLRHGKPFGYFSLSVRNKKGPTISELVRVQGMNAGQSYFYKRQSDAAIRALLDGAAKRGVSMLIIPWSDKGGLEAGVPEMSDVVRKQVSEKVNLFKDHPGLLGWYMADEPEINGVTASLLRDMYELIVELDAYHPCSVLNNSLAGITRYTEGADISMPDPYIIPLKAGAPPTR